MVDVEGELAGLACLTRHIRINHHHLAAVADGIAYLGEAHAAVFHEVLEVLLVVVAHLDYHAWVLGKERLHDVAVLAEVVQIDVHAALPVGEGHLQQGGYQSACRYVVASYHPSLRYQLLYGHEGVGKVFGVLHRRHVAAHLAEALRKGRAAQSLLVEREVYVVQRGVLVVLHHGAHHLADVTHLAASRYDDGARRYDFLAVGVLLGQRQRVLTRGHVDVQLAAEVAQGLHALLAPAGPHPVGTQRQRLHAVGQRCPHDVGQCLGHTQHRACCWVGQACLRSMPQGGGYTLAATIVEGYHTAVAQRQLNLALALLTGYFARHRAVHLVGQPVLAGYGF